MILTKSHFDVPDTLKDVIGKLLCWNRVGIFLGAGVSKPQGLPGWDKLVDDLYAFDGSGSKRPAGNHHPTKLCDHLLSTKFGRSEERLASATRKVMYANVKIDFKSLRENLVLAAIASLVMSSRRGSAPEVFTLNYDSLLETYLRYHGYVVRPMLDESWRGAQDVVINHPHGYLPFDPNEVASERITLTQGSYDYLFANPNFPWRQRILCSLRTKFMIFIGLGGVDGHLTALLTEVYKNHLAITKEQWPYWGVVFTNGKDEVADEGWDMRGIFQIKISDFQTDELSNWLFDLCQRAAKVSMDAHGG